jgi:hypothetical protein
LTGVHRGRFGFAGADGGAGGGDGATGGGATQRSPLAFIPAGHCGTPTHTLRDDDQTCAGQQQWPCVSSLITCPAGQLETGAQVSPRGSKSSGHDAGMPTHTPRAFDHACPGQQQWPAVSGPVDCPVGQSTACTVCAPNATASAVTHASFVLTIPPRSILRRRARNKKAGSPAAPGPIV